MRVGVNVSKSIHRKTDIDIIRELIKTGYEPRGAAQQGATKLTDIEIASFRALGAAGMKVVLFCGGLGLRLRDYSEQIPKPMVTIGYRPILWHVMRYYAHFGHRDFILCLGYRGDLIKKYFLEYNECVSNDFVFSHGGKQLKLVSSDIHDWNITFAETGLHSNIGQRLRAVERYLGDDDTFLANYSDGLSDLDLDAYLNRARQLDRIATFVSVKPNLSFHVATTDTNGLVTGISEITRSGLRVNAGFFVLKRDIFNYMNPGDELVVEPFQRLIQERELAAYEYDGFFAAMDTFKDKQKLDGLYDTGKAPWEAWRAAEWQAQKPARIAVALDSATKKAVVKPLAGQIAQGR
jgi:glucose-1-phosphate cytidylyltransferase